jgi:L-fuconolactonase
MQHLLDSFGATKLMWGSDWPVINLASQYEQWLEMTKTFLTDLPEQDQQSVWATSAETFYKLHL